MLKKIAHLILISFSIATFLSIIFSLGFFETWQLRSSDLLFTSRPVSSDIVIVAIDDKSLQAIGQWPWKRSVHAQLISKIKSAKIIGLDISFLEPSTPQEDATLAQAIKNAGNVVLAAQTRKNEKLFPIAVLSQNAQIGITNTIAGPDGITRQINPEEHFAVMAVGNLQNIPIENGLMRINFASPPGSFKRFSYLDVLESKVSASEFQDKIVLVGATAPDLHDNQLTPVSSGVPMDGVEVLANAIQTIKEKAYLVNEKSAVTILTIFALTVALSLVLSRLNIIPAILVTLVFVFLYLLSCLFAFDNGTIKNLVFPPFAILTTGIVDIIYKYFSQVRQKKFIKKALSFYLSQSVMEEVLKDPNKLKLGGARKNISVLFSDIAGFTTISEKLAPETLARLLNNYLTEMTKIVFTYNGVLDKYIGDAVMAFWGAPIPTKNHALEACQTALEMKTKLQSIKASWAKEGAGDFDVRIGVNTGEMVVGNMGSEMRFDYTLIGDNVNLGSRLEGINKEYGTNIVISQSTYEEVKSKVIARKLDKVAVKGKKQGVVIYELRNLGAVQEDEQEFLANFEKARKLYEKGRFKEALKEFTKFAKVYPKDNPAKVYLERCHALIKQKPKNWDGVFRAQKK
ncbi:MAG: Adenylate cyclase [Candidatus Woesebacteria bacterium GW2011_GWB1_44_11b]|uniref:Adenylate cyclase n=2 Tax=Candidatus Woeseibacteriota TaxID=1752722 RepID=A0A0G1GEX7_9BACT|nr:MAG: Adenylate cyclase [Candidatus Woesebacteria bacterium GW2011_GWB1_44_11b]